MSRYLLGVDVGTGSARAGIFDRDGRMLASASEPIQLWKPRPDFVEQSSEDIWQAIGKAIRKARETAGIATGDVAAISFDATCSLVVLDPEDQPLAVNAEGDQTPFCRNVIVWMDHRALAEAEFINAGAHEVLRYVGGKVSPEMETPKLLWLKSHLPDVWKRAGKFLDLADYLTYRAAGIDARSLCTVVCKWTYLGHEGAQGRWDHDYLRAVGIEDAFDGHRVSNDVRPMGEPLGALTPASARELGLSENCLVGVGIIDAHAGGLGLLGAVFEDEAKTVAPDLSKLETALALIGGTSNCHMAVSREPRFIDGIWGPYFGAMVPGLWLTEGGQSAAGSAIDYVIADHAHAVASQAAAEAEAQTIYQYLNAEIERLRRQEGLPFSALLTRNLHVLPDFNGNRSPYADPHVRALIDGLSLDESRTDHALRYYATLQAVAYGTRDIVRALNEAGYRIETLFATGGGTKNPLWLQEHADATGLTLVLPEEPDAVLLGAAILAARAAGFYATLPEAMRAMCRPGLTIAPNPATASFHEAKFACFQELYREQARRREIMNQV